MRRVTISPEVVSEVHFRDKVAPEDRSILFYNYSEELRFTEDKEEEQRKAEAEGLSWEDWVQRQTDDDVIRDEVVENRDPADYLYEYFDEGSAIEEDTNNNNLMSSIEYGSTEFMEQKSGSIGDENQDHVNYEEDFIENDDIAWEQKPLASIASQGDLMAYEHTKFWQPMDTLREKNLLEELWETNTAPWKVWK